MSEPADTPTVLVKRRRLHRPEHQSGASEALTDKQPPSRPTRVFRLARAADEQAALLVQDEQAANPPAPARKRARRQLHSPVVVTLPPQAMPQLASHEVPRGRGIGLQIPAGLSAQTASWLCGETACLARMRAIGIELARLRSEAEAAKQREGRQAIGWIRKAIAEFGLVASDLAL